MKSITLSKEDVARFWSKVKVGSPDECWEWQNANNGRGYGKLFVLDENGKQTHQYAHRISWELANGKIKKGLWVLHKCDNPKCVNPKHLFLGTQTENMRDAVSKGRLHGSGVRGEAQGSSRLKEGDVLAIRRLLSDGKVRQTVIAKMFNVTPTAILFIKKGKTWSWLNT